MGARCHKAVPVVSASRKHGGGGFAIITSVLYQECWHAEVSELLTVSGSLLGCYSLVRSQIFTPRSGSRSNLCPPTRHGETRKLEIIHGIHCVQLQAPEDVKGINRLDDPVRKHIRSTIFSRSSVKTPTKVKSVAIMQSYLLLALLPAVLACTNPDTNSCASFMSVNSATAGPFCTSFTNAVVTATAGLPAWATHCSNKVKEISKECSCYYTAGPNPQPTTQQPAPTTVVTSVVTATSTGSTPPVETGNCGSANQQQLVGFGVGTTGGGSGAGTTVTSCSALTSAASAGGVIRISGQLSGCGVITVRSGTSFLGVGSNSGMCSRRVMALVSKIANLSHSRLDWRFIPPEWCDQRHLPQPGLDPRS